MTVIWPSACYQLGTDRGRWYAETKKTSAEEYTFLALKLNRFDAVINASINYEVRDSRHRRDDAKVYDFESHLYIEGVCTYPAKRAGATYCLTVYGSEPRYDKFTSILADCHVRNDHGLPKYRKVRGKEVPIYDVPKGIGHLERQRGVQTWVGWIWVPPQTVNDMLTLLPHVRPLYIDIHELSINRNRWLVGLTLQTTAPAAE